MLSTLRRPCVYASSSPKSGSTVRAVLEFHKNGHIPNVEFACVLTGSPDAGVVEIAKAYKIPKERIGIIPRSQYPSDEAHQDALIAFCDKWNADSLWQSGRIRTLGPKVIRRFYRKCWNQHPGKIVTGHTFRGQRLDFGGSGMHGIVPYAAALYFARLTGRPSAALAYVTAHHMEPDEKDIDSGDIVRTLAVPMDIERDTPEDVQARGKRAEQMLMAWVLAEYASTGILPRMEPTPVIADDGEINHLLTAREQARREYPNG